MQTELQTTTAAVRAAQEPASTAAPRKAALGDFETYLRMLTTQLRNQDPLNPMESTEFSVQLATFSSVEQQVRTNQLLETMVGQRTAADLSAFADWLGMEALAVSDVRFTGSPVSIAPKAAEGADRAVLVVARADGTEIARTPVEATGTSMEWAGVSSEGAPLPSGTYRLALESYQGSRLLQSDPVAVYTTVREVIAAADGSVTVVSDRGDRFSAASVLALRHPG